MIPHKLRLQNFLSYGEGLDPLDFAGMHLVCLIGDNGHGKSALLDSITWAVWGKARAVSDDDLIRIGASEMQVEFEFELAGQRYNVIRKRLQSGRSKKTELELAVWDGKESAWQPLTEPTIRNTQARINDVLRMDYETFTNSAFLKQGEADAFTSKSPAERKNVLAAILNLAQYDRYAERAKEQAKAAESEAQHYERRLQEIDNELGQRAAIEAELQTAEVAEIQARLAKQDADQAVMATQLIAQDLQSKEAMRSDLANRVGRQQNEMARTKTQIVAATQQLAELEGLLAERPAIEAGYQRLLVARAEEAQWSERLQARRPLEQEKGRLERELVAARGQIETELAVARRAWEDARARAQALANLDQKHAEVAAELDQLAATQQRAQDQRGRVAQIAAERHQIEQTMERVKTEGTALRERLDLLLSDDTSACPVCQQPLGAEGRGHLERGYEQQLVMLREQHSALSQQTRGLSDEERQLSAAMQHDERELRQMPALQRQLAEIEARLAEARLAAEALPEQEAHVQTLTDRLAQGDFAETTRMQLAALEQQIAALAYDEAAHQRARNTVAELGQLERRQVELERAAAAVEQTRQQVADLQAREQREEAALAEDRARLTDLSEQVAGLAETQRRLREQTQARDAAHAIWQQTLERKAAIQQRLTTSHQLETTRADVLQSLAAAKERMADYRALQEAFGPRGVQAMIIEAALPELEAEANRLLTRLSDGRMNVRFETQRGLKTGGVRETLDIIISDELGSRAYEMFSGGEAFRADLALRIALSRLLANRSGAALQTLFIDEGFGTQDARGRENLVDAIHLIKDDFALVLVITHIDELKEQFPVRIQITKTEGTGSRYVVT